MSEFKISINQFADFQKSTEARKKSIIRQQKYPSKIRIAWYQMPRARFKKVIELNGDLRPIEDGIRILNSRVLEKPMQIQNRTVSLEAMKRFSKLRLPGLFDNPLEVIKNVAAKTILINGVEIIISPDVIFKMNIEGEHYYGAVKIHISKNNIFDYKQSKYISSLLHKYLKENFETDDCKVNPDLCLAIDVFGERIIHSPSNINNAIIDVNIICEEIKYLWNVA